MRRLFDDTLTGKDLFQYLWQNKSSLISRKKASIKTTDEVVTPPELYLIKDRGVVKAAPTEEIPESVDKVRAKFVGNSALWFDSQEDVLLRDCWNKSVKDRNGRLHLKDHTYKTDAEVGEVFNIYNQEMSLTDLGYDKAGTTQALIYESDVYKSYDEKIFNRYRLFKAKQHSIGLRYKQIMLAINDPDYKDEFATWNQYIGQVINQEDAIKSGYMWIVPEIQLVEVSVVLLGANLLTPQIEVEAGKGDNENETDNAKNTVKQPEVASTVEQPYDWRADIRNRKFINL